MTCLRSRAEMQHIPSLEQINPINIREVPSADILAIALCSNSEKTYCQGAFFLVDNFRRMALLCCSESTLYNELCKLIICVTCTPGLNCSTRRRAAPCRSS